MELETSFMRVFFIGFSITAPMVFYTTMEAITSSATVGTSVGSRLALEFSQSVFDAPSGTINSGF
jgi:hypothetical protein